MSNIPFNTVASVLATGALQRQAAAAIDRRTHEAARTEKVQAKLTRQHTEEVEDPGAHGLQAVNDDRHPADDQRKPKQHAKSEEPDARQEDPSAQVDIAGLEATPAPQANPAPAPQPRLDISA